MKIQADDKKLDAEEFENRNRAKLDLINDINTNGGFYRGRFGMDQRFYYSFKNLQLMSTAIYCDVTTLVTFYQDNGTIHIEYREETFKAFENYGVEIYEKITKSDFDKAYELLQGFKNQLWKD